MANHDDKIAPHPLRPRVGSHVLVTVDTPQGEAVKRGKVVGMRAAEVSYVPADTTERVVHYRVLFIVVFGDGSAWPFAENEVELAPTEEASRIIRPGQVQPAPRIKRG